MSYMDIIKAKRAEMDAHKLAEELEKKRQHEACAEAFKDFRDVWAEVKNTLVPHYNSSARGKLLLEEHCERLHYSETVDTRTSFRFWSNTGNGGEYFKVEWDEDAGIVAFRAGFNCGPDRTVTKAQLMEEFLNFLARRMPS